MPDLVTQGINLANTSTYYYFNTWRVVGNAASANDTILPPTVYFTLRNPATPTAGTTFTPSGGRVYEPVVHPARYPSLGAAG